MTDPTRLLDMAASDSELHLLRAGAVEEPPPEALQRLALVLGVSAAPSGASSGAHPAVTSAPAAGGVSVGVIAKLGALIVGSVSLGAAIWLNAQPTPPAPAREPRSLPVLPVALPERAAPPAPLPPVTEPALPEPVTVPLRAAVPEREHIRARVTVSLAQEIASLDAVRAQLAASDARAALGTVQRYMREHPRGALRQEAAVLRIEALQSAGQPARARAAAARFLKENPDSPHTPRVRALADAL